MPKWSLSSAPTVQGSNAEKKVTATAQPRSSSRGSAVAWLSCRAVCTAARITSLAAVAAAGPEVGAGSPGKCQNPLLAGRVWISARRRRLTKHPPAVSY